MKSCHLGDRHFGTLALLRCDWQRGAEGKPVE